MEVTSDPKAGRLACRFLWGAIGRDPRLDMLFLSKSTMVLSKCTNLFNRRKSTSRNQWPFAGQNADFESRACFRKCFGYRQPPSISGLQKEITRFVSLKEGDMRISIC